jgi:transcriptional regulator with XRE-family HTH domain
VAKKGTTKTPKSVFGAIVFWYRHKKGWSQEVLAASSSLSRDFISKLENGLRMASLKTMAKLAPHFELTPSELYQVFIDKMKEEGLYDKWVKSRGQ